MSDPIAIHKNLDCPPDQLVRENEQEQVSALTLFEDWEASYSMDVSLPGSNHWRNPPLSGRMDMTKENARLFKPDPYHPSIQQIIMDRLQTQHISRIKIFCFLLVETLIGIFLVYLVNH